MTEQTGNNKPNEAEGLAFPLSGNEKLIESRFWAQVTPTGFCWEWDGRKQKKTGHGRYQVSREKSVAAHRHSYETLVGPIPDGLTLDHLCRNPPCVNPDHLDPVTNAVNVLRGFGITAMQKRQTHCKHNHEFTAENTYTTKRGIRQCRECHRVITRVNSARIKTCETCGKAMRLTSLYRHMKEVHGEA